MQTIKQTVENNVAILTIDNPPVNALSKTVTSELLAILEKIENNDQIRAVMIIGEGNKAFMAGADIKEFLELLDSDDKIAGIKKFSQQSHQMFNTLAQLSKPTIAVLNGLALGGGCELALACDFRIATNKSQLGLPEINLGLYPGGGGTQRLPRLIGTSRAKELMFLGKTITAEEAYQIGLVNMIVSEEELIEKAQEFANELASRPGFALKLIKQIIDQGVEIPLRDGLALEADLFKEVFSANDASEGIRAFTEKRKPKFTHS